MSVLRFLGKAAPTTRARLLSAVAIAVAVLVTAANVYSQVSVPCSDPGWPADLFCFSPNTPAKANEINGNFKQLSDEMEQLSDEMDARVIPVGSIVMWSGSTGSIPTGWALCNGNNGTPDLRDRFVVGAGSSYAVSDTGGASSVTLSTAQMPSHYHWITDDQRSYYLFGGDSGNLIDHSDSGGNIPDLPRPQVSHTASTGGDQAHENRPPYYALAFIMKV